MPSSSVANGQFRMNARNIFLTYPRCNLSKETLLEELIKIKPPHAYVISMEVHEDGAPHLHALLKYTKPINITNPNYWDVKGFHPNMQTARDVEAVKAYVEKDGNFIINWAERKKMDCILADAETPSQFLELVKENYPEQYVFQLEKVEYAANKLFIRPPSPYESLPLKDFILPNDVKEWARMELTSTDRPKSLWLCGPSRTGKTVWARSLGTHVYWNGSFMLDTFDERAQYMVLDDIKWEYVPAKKALFGGQKEFTLSDKYRRKRRIKWGKPVIYLFNPDENPWDGLGQLEKDWYKENIVRSFITNKLFI